jgi:hypothetical protein
MCCGDGLVPSITDYIVTNEELLNLQHKLHVRDIEILARFCEECMW